MSGNLIGATFARVIPNRTQGSPPSVSLVQAARTGNIAAVNQHIKAGSDLNQRNDFDESTPIIVAAAFGRDDVVRALIEARADLAATNNQRQTALHAAAFFCRQSTVEMLIAAKMDLAAVNYQGETAYDIVASPMTKELRYVYRYIYGLLKLDLDLEKIEAERKNIAKTLFSHQQN
jgi:ankyrin repeat protein